MCFYTDEGRCRTLLDTLRSMQDAGESTHQQAIIDRCTGPMGNKTAWKALKTCEQEGAVVKTEGQKPTGQTCYFFRLEDWYILDEEQRERMVVALEAIADHLLSMDDRMARQSPAPVFNGPVSTVNTGTVIYEMPKHCDRETKIVRPEESK